MGFFESDDLDRPYTMLSVANEILVTLGRTENNEYASLEHLAFPRSRTCFTRRGDLERLRNGERVAGSSDPEHFFELPGSVEASQRKSGSRYVQGSKGPPRYRCRAGGNR